MVKCVFCGYDSPFMNGINIIGNDGTVSYYCSGKCRKNDLKLGRDKKKLKWTEAYRIKRAKEVVAEDKEKKEAKAKPKAAEKKVEAKK
jgi:large subunit ribosomal protein L24e